MYRVLGRWIAVLRLDCGLSRRSLAERLGVPPSTVEQWENESAPVPPEFLGALAATLRVSPEDLLALHAYARRPQPRKPDTTTSSKKRSLVYPVKGTLAEMLALGEEAGWRLSAQVEGRLTKPVYERFLRRFPRDNALQLLAAHHLVALGAEPRTVSLLDLGCGLLVTNRTRRTYDGERARPALMLAREDWLLVLVAQVPLGVPGCPQIYRSDFLCLYVDSYGHRQWLDVTIDDPPAQSDPHAMCPHVLDLARLHFTHEDVQDTHFATRFLIAVRRFMTSDVADRDGITTIRVRQPARIDPPAIHIARALKPEA